MKLYRLERKGLGPFTQSTKVDKDWLCSAAMPDLIRFKKGDNRLCFLSATDSEDKLKNYFRETYDLLLDEGFEVREYEAPKRRVRDSRLGHEYAFHAGTTDAALIFQVRRMLA